MPELPEMQALAERLEAAVGGATFESATPIAFSALKTFSPAPESLAGRALACLLYTSPSPRDKRQSRMPSSA